MMHDLDDDHVPQVRGVSKKIYFFSCLSMLIVGGLIGFYTHTYVNTQLIEGGLNLTSVQDTYKKFKDSYDGTVSANTLIEGANRGLIEAANDPYTVYMNRAESKQFEEDLEGTFSGIGAELDKRDGQLVIVTPLDGSPAKEVGLQSKDIILKVNDEDTTKWTIDQAVSKIKGKAGTTVKLSIFREDTIKEFTITRAIITTPSVTSTQIENVGVVTISRFSEDTAMTTRRSIENLKQKGVTKLVIDLRNNGGGYLDQANEIASLWIPKGKTVVTERRGNKIVEKHVSSGEGSAAKLPTVVLINNGSASASEIVAGALKDYKLATLVGEKSFGKGSVQSKVELADGATLKVTIARWFTPNGKNINKHGIEPDQKVMLPEDASTDNDPQKQRALEVVNSL